MSIFVGTTPFFNIVYCVAMGTMQLMDFILKNILFFLLFSGLIAHLASLRNAPRGSIEV